MNRLPKNLIATAVVFIFALAVWCASLSIPAQVMASRMPDCSMPGSVVDYPCQPLLCNLATSHKLLSQGGVVSSKSDGPAKDGLFLLGAVLPVLSHNDSSLAADRLPAIWTDYRSEKVSVHLFNSVLIL